MNIQDPHSFTDSTQGKITHIDFNLDVHFSSRVVSGSAHYQFDRLLNGSLFLDCRDLSLGRIYAGTRDLEWEIDGSDDVLGQRLHIKSLVGISEFTIEFSTSPDASALQWLEPDQTAGGSHPYLYSQSQSIHARSIFPCQDTPSIRFTYTADIVVPAPLIAVMAAEALEVLDEGEINRCRFRMPQAIPSYLFAVAIGNISYRDVGPRCRIYAEPEMIEQAAWEFAHTEDKLKEAERLLGPYEWDRYDMLLMPPSFPYGGMENPRLTFLTPSVVVGDRSRTAIVTHELAHSWTGNLVTNATWEDFWLNEGWTTYAQQRIDEVLEGRDYAQLTAAVGRQSMFEAMQRFGMDSDPTRLKSSMKGVNPDAVASTIPYHKGCAFLVAIEQAVGSEAFASFVKKYIATYRFQSLTTEEFIQFLESELPKAVELVDVDEWLYEPGFPDSAPSINASLLDDVMAQVQAYQKNGLPSKDVISKWTVHQIELFLLALPPSIPVEDCKRLQSLFDLDDSRDGGLLHIFYALAIRSGYKDILPQVEELLGRFGRILFLGRIYRALAQTEWSRPLVHPIVSKHRHRYHPLAIRMIERVMSDNNL